MNDEALNWISGGCFPAFCSSLDYLYNKENVGLIITLTIEPIKSGRNINHVPFDHDETEWVNGDENLEEKLSNFETLHIPIADVGFPTKEYIDRLAKTVEEYHQNNPIKSVYFHCWAGRGRTSLAIIYILMRMYKMNSNAAIELVKKCNRECKLSEYQLKFIKGMDLSLEDLENFASIIKTPSDHECFKIK